MRFGANINNSGRFIYGEKINSMLVWDQPGLPDEGIKSGLLWQSYADNMSLVSIPHYLEAHAERLKAKYLGFIHDLGQSHVNGRSIVDHLDMGEGFSFWWMTKLAEKSPYKSSRIYDCLRLLALEEILRETPPAKLCLRSSDRALAQAIRELCRSFNIKFSWQLPIDNKRSWSLRRLYRNLPHSAQGCIGFLKHLISHWSLNVVEKRKWYSTKSAIFICSYFIHLDGEALKQGKFYSRQWEQLPQLLQDKGFQINWLQIFLLSSVVPNTKTGIDSLNSFNGDSKNQGLHAFLDTYLTPRVVVRAFKRYLLLQIVSWRLRHVSVNFSPAESVAWLWPLLRDDWLSSIVGSTASINCLWFELFDSAMRHIPHQKNGLYLCENQGWERALLHAWRKHGHGRIIGVPHTTVPFWHLYYFDDPRTINANKKNRMPLPDQFAVNGSVAWTAFVSSGYSINQLVKVEALRYLNLLNIPTKNHFSSATCPLPNLYQSVSDDVNILVLGDYVLESNLILLRLLAEAIRALPKNYKFTFKSHPGLQFDATIYPDIKLEQTFEPIGGVLEEFDMVVSANGTSAAVDAYLAGWPVIIGLDGSSMNLSPLRGENGVSFVGTAEEMVSALLNHTSNNANLSEQKLFWLDRDLPRWNQLLATMNVSGYSGPQ